jgi:putative PIN family toxin of toxin-antitoxin system
VKIVLDTNVIVSGLLKSKGNPAVVLSLALSGAIQICHDRRILAEYSEVLARPRFKFDSKRVGEVLAKLSGDGIPVTPSQLVLDLPDSDDEAFLAVALGASADFLVTGNVADYPPDKRRGICIATPAEFVALWRARFPDAPKPLNPRSV